MALVTDFRFVVAQFIARPVLMHKTTTLLRTTALNLLFLSATIHLAIGNPPPTTTDAIKPLFTEITSDLLLNDAPNPLPDGTYALPEIMGGGVSLFDYDNDGDLDLLRICFPPPGQPSLPAPNLLFQQQPDGTFLDVTSTADLDDSGYGQGAAVGDTDNDGDLDVYVTNFGRDAFYLNNGDGTFVNATVSAGFSGDHWSSSGAFLDYDRDGDLDLYIVHYLLFDSGIECRSRTDRPVYCGPKVSTGCVTRSTVITGTVAFPT